MQTDFISYNVQKYILSHFKSKYENHLKRYIVKKIFTKKNKIKIIKAFYSLKY